MIDQFAEVTTTSWLSRIMGSIKGIVVGLFLFIIAFPLIWWNEGRSVERIITLDEAGNSVISVSSESVDNANNQALIHISGEATTDEVLRDSVFGIEENAIKIRRTVEVFQWQEDISKKSKKNLGGSETTEKTYSYEKVWSENLIDSSTFNQSSEYQNPSSVPFETENFSSTDVTVGAFGLSSRFIGKISNYTPLTLTPANFDAMSSELKPSFKLVNNQYFKGDVSSPQIGATRISYEIVKPHIVSIMGKQDNVNIEPYMTKNGQVDLLKTGTVGAEAMIAIAESENATLTWILRFVALILMWLGLKIFLGPIQVLGDFVPFLGGLVGASISLISGLVAIALTSLTVALAWVFFRPVIGIALLILSAGALFAGYRLMSKGKKKNFDPAAGSQGRAPAPHGMPQAQGYALPQGYTQPQQGYAQPQGHAPQQHAAHQPQAYAPQPHMQQQPHAHQGYAPQAHMPQHQAPQHQQQGYAPHAHTPQYAPQAPTPPAPTPPSPAAKPTKPRSGPIEFVPQLYIPPA